MTRPLLCCLSALIAALAITSAAKANITYSGCVRDPQEPGPNCHRPFVFEGHINKGDPINLVFHGGAVTTPNADCMGNNARSATCVVNMIGRAWGPNTEMKERLCDSGARLKFRTESGGTVNPESDKSMTTSGTCRREYHVRLWGDTAHGHAANAHKWVIGAIHHETRCFVPVACSHKIDMNWEDVENEAVRQLARQANNEFAYCVEPDYYPLVGSNPPGKKKSKYMTGYPSRISFQDRSAGCSGA